MMDDIILVTADSVRRDYADEFDALASFDCGTGVTAAHYTRPSLASLLSSQFEAALTTEVVAPTLPEQLADVGYTCLGFSPTPNTNARFGFDRGFDIYDTFVEPGKQGSVLREYLSKFDLLRRLYYQFKPPQAKSDERPADRTVVDAAIEQFNAAQRPRFLWLHLMGTHRPYGAKEGISNALDRKAYFDADALTPEERETIEAAYRGAIQRVDENVSYLLDNLDATSRKFVFTSDHGEAFGEPGFYFHKGHERCVGDVLTKVPVVTDNLPIETPVSLLDLPPTILDACDIPIPDAWDGRSRSTSPAESTLTIAPWGGKTTLAWQDFEKKVIARDTSVELEGAGSVVTATAADVDAELEAQLRDLGYRDAG